jgi:hypothetical protein
MEIIIIFRGKNTNMWDIICIMIFKQSTINNIHKIKIYVKQGQGLFIRT